MIIQTTTTNVIESLSYTEMSSLKALVNELDGAKEKLIVMSNIADGMKTTRSVFVNVIRKLEACGVLRTNSLGMKGMLVVVINPEALKDIAEG